MYVHVNVLANKSFFHRYSFLFFSIEKPTKLTPAEALRLYKQKKEEIKRQKNMIYKARYKAKKKAKEAELATQNPAPIVVKIETEPKILTKEEKRREYKRLWTQKKRAERKLQKQKAEARKEKNRIYKRLQRQKERLGREALQQKASFSTITQAEWLGENLQAEGQSDEGLSVSDTLGVKEEEFEAKLESVSISLDLGGSFNPENPTPFIKEEIVDDTISS